MYKYKPRAQCKLKNPRGGENRRGYLKTQQAFFCRKDI